MGIMPYYPDERSIENELGGKWELFFEETRDVSGNVGYDFSKDIDDTPINLNGIMIVFDNDNNIFTANSTNVLSINGNNVFSVGLGNTVKHFVIKCKNNNGCLDLTLTQINSNSLTTNTNKISSYASETYLINSISEFTYSSLSVSTDTKIKIYVLRGV